MRGATSPCLYESGTHSVSKRMIPSVTIDWTVRCDWLQVASSRIFYTHDIMQMRATRLVQVLQDLLQVLL